MQKHEWRKKEKQFYLPKNQPEIVDVPMFKFITIEGEGNPNSPFFSECISVLYSIAYAIKMTMKKKEVKPSTYTDYTVYPLEGIWDLKESAKQSSSTTFSKDDLVFKIMIRQPAWVDEGFFREMLDLTKKKKPHELLDKVNFQEITDGKCVQMMHIGSYDDEPASFVLMEKFADSEGLTRLSKRHREIYLSDFRKVAPEKLKTILRFWVASSTGLPT